MPTVYFTNRGHGEYTIIEMFEQGHISEKSKNDLLEFIVNESTPFAYAENLYTGEKHNIQTYSRVIEDGEDIDY